MGDLRSREGARVAVSDSIQSATLIGRNASFRLAGQVLSALINVAGMVLLGNYLGSAGYGQYVFYYSLIPLIASMNDLGVGAITTREIARHRGESDRLLGDALLVKAGVSAALFLVGTTVAWLALTPAHAALLTIVLAAATIDLSQDPSVWVFRAHERQELESLLLLVSQITWVGGIAFCVAMHASIASFLVAAAIAFLIRLLVGWWVLSRQIHRPRFAPNWARLRHLVLLGLPFGLAMFGIVLYARVGVLMLQSFSTAPQVALFNVAYMLSQPLGFISSALSMAAFPALSRYALRGSEALRPALLRASKYQLVIALPLTVGLFLLSDRLIPILFHGTSFTDAAQALKVLSLSLVFIFMNLQSRYLLTAMDRQSVYLKAVGAGLLVNVTLGILLIPGRGFLGACFGQIAGEFVIFGICQASLSSVLGLGDLMRVAWRPAAAAIWMGAIMYVARSANPLVVAPVGACAYLLGFWALKGVSTEEWRVLRAVYLSFGFPGLTRWSRVVGKP